MATQPAAGSNPPPQHKEVEHFSEAERAEWLKTGAMPALEEEKVPPSDEKSKDASAASKPASESRGKESGSGPGKKERSQEENWRALETERDMLRTKAEAAEKELEEYRSGKRKPEEKKPDANAASTGPKLLELPKRPSMSAHRDAAGALDVEKYEAALDEYERAKEAYTNQQVQLRTAAQQQEQSVKTWQSEIKTKYGEKSDGLDVKKTVDALASTLQAAPAFFMFLNDSEVFTDLVFVLGTDPKLDELLAEAKDPKTVTRAIRKLVALEAGVKQELAKQAAGKGDKGEPPKKENITKAGKPPMEAAGGSSTPEDDGSADAAWRRKDLSAAERGELYRERKNKEEREKRKKKPN